MTKEQQTHRNRDAPEYWTTEESHADQGTLFDYLSLIRSSSLKLVMILFHNWANLAAFFSLLEGIYKKMWINIPQDSSQYSNHHFFYSSKGNLELKILQIEEITTSSNLRENVAFNPFFFGSLFSIGISRALKAPGSDWKRDLSIPKVRICNHFR